MNIFLDANHNLRSGWKLAAYLAIFFILLFAMAMAVSVFTRGRNIDDQLTSIALNDIVLGVPAVLALWLTARFVDHRPVSAFGVGFLPHWARDFGIGLAIAAGMLAVLMAGCFAFGYVRMSWTGPQVPAGVLLATLSVLLLAAANEELLFRGFSLQVLREGIGMWPAVILLSALFGAMHLFNPNASVLGTINTGLAGVLLSIAYLKTRSLWLPYGIHVGWNLGLGFVLGFPLSGIDIASMWTTGVAGSDTILGGDYGPEGGLLATFIFATAALWVYRIKRNIATDAHTKS